MDRAGKKTAAAVRDEIACEVDQWLQVLFRGQRKTGHIDVEAVEMMVRSGMQKAGAAGLQEMLAVPVPSASERSLPCACGERARYQGLRSKALLTAVGEVKVSRPYYWCEHCHRGQFPADADLDIELTGLSPGVRRMLALVGADGPFDHGRQQVKLLAGLDVTTKAVERTAEVIGEHVAECEQREIQRAVRLDLPVIIGEPIPILYVQMDGTGVPVVKKEAADRKGKTDGEPAHTREVKLGCIFTQKGWDDEGYALRDPDSTTYTGAIETAEAFGKRLYNEAWNRGWNRAAKKVVIGDGAEWIWNLADQHFPGAVQIVDLYHAREHLWELARKLHPNDAAAQKTWVKTHQNLLDGGNIETLVTSLRAITSSNVEVTDKLCTEANYFEKNSARMRYPDFRLQHLLVGSGVIEAGCKTVIGSRIKQSGMFWTLRGANSIIDLRCCHLNGRFENYWEARAA